MIDRNFIEKIEELTLQGETPREIDGRTFYRGREIMDVELDAITLSTLGGFAELAECLFVGGVPIFGAVVTTPESVCLLGNPDKHKRRGILAYANSPDRGSFPFENWLSQEDFVTMAQACFVRTDELDDVLRLVGTLKAGRVTTYEDDGVTQQVNAAAGVTRATHVEVPNPVSLCPWRTFVEIEQPPSDFILRLRGGDENQKPQIGLYEVIGGGWKLAAMTAIAAHLREIMEGEIPIFV
jgi:hypothetical protein